MESSLLGMKTTYLVVCAILLFSLSVFWQIYHVHVQEMPRAPYHSVRSSLRQWTAQQETVPVMNMTFALKKSLLSHEVETGMKRGIRHSRINFDEKGAFENLPAAVKSWRQAKLDWHDLVPKHNSKWERFGDAPKGYKLRNLVDKEVMVTNYLTRFHESGLSTRYGKDHGRLSEYATCNVLDDPCMAHGSESCQRDGYCTWHEPSSSCREWTSSWSPASKPPDGCAAPKSVQNGKFTKVQDVGKECKHFITSKTALLSFDSESQSMFYHWWASFQTLYHALFKGDFAGDRNTNFIVQGVHEPMLYVYLGTLSDNCWRRLSQVPSGTCFCDSREFVPGQHHGKFGPQAASYIKKYVLGSEEERAAARTVRAVEDGESDRHEPGDDGGASAKVGVGSQKFTICLISRRKKRFLLNEYELCVDAAHNGYECKLLPLEHMTIHEQLVEFDSCDILAGMHGSGLDNSVFLRPKETVLLQILPFKSEFRASFPQSAASANVIYQEWMLKDRSKTLLHWDLFEQANSEAFHSMSKQDIIERGSRGFGTRETAMFWINQDIVVPLDEWRRMLRSATQAVSRVREADMEKGRRSGIKLPDQ